MHQNINKIALERRLDIDKFVDFCNVNYDKFHLCGLWIDTNHADDLVKAYLSDGGQMAWDARQRK